MVLEKQDSGISLTSVGLDRKMPDTPKNSGVKIYSVQTAETNQLDKKRKGFKNICEHQKQSPAIVTDRIKDVRVCGSYEDLTNDHSCKREHSDSERQQNDSDKLSDSIYGSSQDLWCIGQCDLVDGDEGGGGTAQEEEQHGLEGSFDGISGYEDQHGVDGVNSYVVDELSGYEDHRVVSEVSGYEDHHHQDKDDNEELLIPLHKTVCCALCRLVSAFSFAGYFTLFAYLFIVF